MKKLIAILLVIVCLAALTACTADDGKFTVGICQLAPHPALDAATNGFKDALIAEFGSAGVEFIYEQAANETSNCVSIVNTMVSSKVDLLMANATPALQAAANATRVIPILGTSVTEYGVALGIENFDGLVGTNISGTSDLADLKMQAEMILEWCPDVKKVSLLYCSAEPNSQYQVDEVQKNLEAKGVECQQFGFTDTNDMSGFVQDAMNWGDAIYVPTDNTVADNATVIDGICRGKIPVFTGEEGICKLCGVATLSISYYDLGYTTGQMAARILRNEEKVSEMRIEYAPAVTPKYNPDICEALGMKPLDGYVPVS